MRIYFLTSQAFGLCFIIIVQSCLFKLISNNDGKKLQEKQSGKTRYIRKLYPDTVTANFKCVCGKFDGPSLRGWEVVVYTRESDSEPFIRSCMGAIIAHNLVLTSHKCLTLKGKQMRPYETWQPTPKHKETSMKSVDNIRIGVLEAEITETVNMTYNADFSVYAAAKDVASADDIAVIVVNDDLFQLFNKSDDNGTSSKVHIFLPVCLPVKDEKTDLLKDVLHRHGFLYGYGGQFATDSGDKLETRSVNELVILDGKECDEDQNVGDFSTSGSLCIRTVSPLPSLHGGLLLTNGNDCKELARPRTDQTAFLAGLGTVTEKRPPGKSISYAYFANVFKHLEYIEKVANQHGSMWCNTPLYVPSKEDKLKLEEWPWESENKKARSETLDCACGFKNTDKTGRIANGENATAYEFGWMVKIFGSYIPGDVNLSKGGYLCGGSIINDRMFLPAAHCVVERRDERNPNGIPFEPTREYNVSIGAHSYKNFTEGQFVKIKQIIRHPGYVPNLQNNVYSYDLALIVLEEPIKFAKATTLQNLNDNDIRPICLPKIGQQIELKNGTVITAMGWGASKYVGGSLGQVLQKIQVPIRDMKYCVGKIRNAIPDTVFCIANYNDEAGVAGGDSGGPLVFQKENGQHFQVGAVSYGVKLVADGSKWLGFIADVQQFLPFIEYYSHENGAQWCKK